MKKSFFIVPLLILSVVLVIMFLPNLTTSEIPDPLVEAVPIQELDTLPFKKTYSVTEILNKMKNMGYTDSDIKNFKRSHENNLKTQNFEEDSSTKASIRYSAFKMDGFKFSKGSKNYHLQPQLLVGLSYSTSTSPDKILSLGEPYIYTKEGSHFIFDGDLVYKLISNKEFTILTQGRTYKRGKSGEDNSLSGFIKDISYQETYYSSDLDKKDK